MWTTEDEAREEIKSLVARYYHQFKEKEKTAFSVPIEYFYLEDPVVNDEYFPLKIF